MKLFGWAAALAGLLIIMAMLWMTFSIRDVPGNQSCIHDITQTTGGTVWLPPVDTPEE